MNPIYFGDNSRENEVITAQKKLKELGYYPFGIDGKYGVGTYNAVMKFQADAGLKIDGVLGEQTYNALANAQVTTSEKKSIAVKDVLAVMKKKKYKINDKQFQINIVGIREDNIFDNLFSDKLFVFWKNEKMEWESYTAKWTTMPGTLGQGGVFKPITVLGITGVAVLVEGQYIDAYEFVDSYSGWLCYPYFQQVGKVKVYRDGDRDTVLDYDMPTQEGHFGINLHRMSNNNIDTDTVNLEWVTWTMGCQGNPEPHFKKLVDFARITAKFFGKRFTYTLINRNDFA